MDKIKGIQVYHASKPGSGSVQDSRLGIRDREIEELPTKQLVSTYLCKKAESMCVTKGECENLSVCAYGKEYVRRKAVKADE